MTPLPKKPFKLSIGQLFIVLGILSALLTFVLFKAVFQASKPVEQTEVAHKVETKTLIVSNRYLMPGEVVQSTDVREVEWPEDFYPSEVVFTDEDEIVGKAVKVDVFPGQPIYKLNLTGTKSRGGLPLLIPNGMRAITIAISEVKGVAGLIKPGDRVDVIGNFTYPVNMAGGDKGNMQDASLSQTILQNVKVLAVAQAFDQVDPESESRINDEFSRTGGPSKKIVDNSDAATGESTDKKPAAPAKVEVDTSALNAKVATSVTLAVTPEQAQVIALAEFKGDLKLVLRPEEDEVEEHVVGTSEGDMIFDSSVFQKALDFLSLRNVFTDSSASSSSSSAAMPSAPMNSGGGYAPSASAGNYAMPSMPASSGEKRVQVIEGTQVSDVYVPKKR